MNAFALVPIVLGSLVLLSWIAYLVVAAWCVSGDSANTPEENL